MTPYTPLPSTKAFHESPARVKVLWGPLGTGKSSAGLWEYILQCAEEEIPLDGMVVRTSYRELRDTTVKTFFNWFGEIATWHESDSLAKIRLPSAKDPKVIIEHVLRFRSLERPEDAKKVQSFEGAFVMIDEAAPTFTATGAASAGMSQEIVEYSNARLRHVFRGQQAKRYTQVIVSNPPPPTHWLYKKYLSRDPDELAKLRGGVSVHFTPREENEKNLPDDYYGVLCDAFGDPDLVRRLVEGEIVATYAGEAVFPECQDRVHVTSERLFPTPGVALVLGFDYGHTPATLISQIAPNGQWRWLTEVQSVGTSFEVHLDVLRTHLNEHYHGYEFRCWGDPAGHQASQTDQKTCVEMGQAAGFTIKPGRMDWQSRKDAIKNRLLRNVGDGHPALLISRPGCPILTEGMLGAYRYPKTAAGDIGTRPIKNIASHLADAAQYVATREFELNPRALKQENKVVEFVPRAMDPFRAMGKRKVRGSWQAR